MKKAVPVFFFFLIQILSINLMAQVTGKIAYSDTFVQGVTYCPSNNQYSSWGTFRAKLDTTNYTILSITMKGTYDATGRTCSDSFMARKLAHRLKNPISGSDLTVTCGSYTWVVAGLGSCISGGSCASTSDNVGISADGASAACNCYTPSYQMRPIIGNGNWGGVNTNSCPGLSQRMTLEFTYRLYPVDAAISAIAPADLCTNPNQVNVTVKNAGSKTLDSVRIYWSLNGNMQPATYLNKKILVTKDTSLTLKTGLNYNPYTTYTIKVWTSKPNGTIDNYFSNDTLKYTFVYLGFPKVPDARDTVICGSGIKTLVGKPDNSMDTLLWYSSNTSNTILGVGRYFKTPFLTPGTYNYFLGSAGKLVNNSIQTNFSGGNQQAGFMLNVTALQNSSIDSIGVNIGAGSGTSANLEVYYRDGGYAGYETNSTAWTLLGKYTVMSKGTGIPTSVPAKISVPVGKTYGFYIQTTSAPSFYLQYGNLASSVTSDATLQINTGVGVALNWGTTFNGRNGNIRFYYKTPSCISLRDSMKLTIKSKPTGAASIKGSPFDSPNTFTTGTKINPDIVAVGKELNYELQPPTGYYNSGFGSLWVVTDVRVLKQSGKSVPNSDTALKLPTVSTNGKLKFIPSASLEDSLVTIYTTLQDLVTSKCDTLLQRSVYIAPTPKTNFSCAGVCFGTPVEFKNLTKIRSGSVSYKWEFGNGDTSNQINPIYNYPTHGTYTVKLTAKSNFGIIKDTIIKLTIYEIPDIKFKVFNACMGDSLSFVNSTTIGSGTISYKWDLGDGKTSTKTSLKHKYLIASSYIVTLFANANGCSSSLSKKAHQFAKPVADFSVNGSCTKVDIYFQNNTTINIEDRFGSSWKFGDGNGNNETNPTHTYNSPGLKTVKYTATSQFGCSDSMVKTISIQASPLASFTYGPVCSVKPVEFTNTTDEPVDVITSYIWNFGDSYTTNLKNPQHHYAELGSKTIKLVALGNNGCSTSIEKTITVLQQPVANFEALDACIGSEVVFTNKTTGGGIINFKWRFGDGDSSSLFSPTKTYKTNVASTYNVTLTAKNIGGCQDVITIPVNIKETPKCGFTFKSSGTGGFEYSFTPNVLTYPFYQWTFEGGGNSNLVTPRHAFPADGNYRVRVFMKTADGCECLDSGQIISVNHLGINNLKENYKLRIFPNPNNGNFSIELPAVNLKDYLNLSIIDFSGRVVYETKIKENYNLTFSLPDLTNGLYLIKINRNGGFSTFTNLLINR